MADIIISKLDPAQIIRKAYDEPNNRIRVDAELSNLEVEISVDAATGDNVAIANQTGDTFLAINPDGSINTNSKSGNADAFGRNRVSEPFTLGDYKHTYGTDPGLLDKTINGATVTHSANKSCATLTTSSNSASSAIHQTKAYHQYQPGKSQMILSSVCFGYAQQNVTKRTGYFDDRDGIYFEQVGSNTSSGIDNGQLNFVIRSYTSGTASEAAIGSYLRRVPQSQWNKDKCDGTGASGFNINTSKTILVYIDFQWLGVGRVRVGFVHDGEFVVAHEYYHSNVLDTVYMSNPSLPVRCEILNTGATSGGSMDQICSTVASEGGYIENGIDWSILSGLRTTSTPSGTVLPVMAIRLKNTFNGNPNRMLVKLNNISIYAETNSIQYELIKVPDTNGILGTLTWTSADDSSGVEYCVNATGIYIPSTTNIDKLASGYAAAGSSQNSLSTINTGSLTASKRNFISQNFDSSNSEIYVLLARTVTSAGNVTANVAVSFQWREIY